MRAGAFSGVRLMAKHVVATVKEIPPGGRKLVEINARAIVVFNLGGEFFALNNRCPHRGGSLHLGIQTGLVESKEPGQYCYSRPGEMVKCPWHGWEFDIRTGKSWCDPNRVRIRCATSPTIPRRNNSTQITKIVPCTTNTHCPIWVR